MAKELVRIHGSGPGRDEGGTFRVEERPTPAWVTQAQKKCAGCHDNFYNHRANCTGNHWCFSLERAKSHRGKGRPSCFH